MKQVTRKSLLSLGMAALASGMFVACASAQPAPDTKKTETVTPAQSARVQRHAEGAFAELDGKSADSTSGLDDVSAAAETARNEKAADAAGDAGSTVTAEAAVQENPAAETAAEPAQAAAETADAADTSAAASAEAAPADTQAQAAADEEQSDEETAGDAGADKAAVSAAVVPVGDCVFLRAPGRRASQSAKDTLCRNARYDLSCTDGRIEVETLATGAPFHPWTFVARGCGQEATYHMVGDLIRHVTSAPDSTLPRADGRPPACVVEPYVGRQVSRRAHGIICNEARNDLQCADGDLRIIVLQIGRGPAPWHFAVEGCGYSVRYLMKGNTLGRLQ